MRSQKLHHLSARLTLALSLIALFTVLTGDFRPRQPDEGAGHISRYLRNTPTSAPAPNVLH